ncbi:MAG: alpha-mannosidase [Clostridia bacterium]|nr:alpha-mannosidase [Clostridia bacterium]
MEKKLFMIGNAHLDPVWLWTWQDGYAAARATFRSVLDRMNEYPEFVFTSAAVCYYEWIEHCDPEMFKEIAARVREGRWRMVGGWWIQPDCNIPSGESFARQALIAQNYLKAKFGVTARTGYNGDSFGHSGSLPAILRLSGMDRYVYMRPGVHERAYPAWTFRWQTPTGEEVTAFRIPYEYCTWPDTLKTHISRCVNEIKDENGLMCFYGVGNHGGGPTRQNIESIKELDGADGARLVFSHPDEFFDSVRGELPVVNGDLLHHASGCYSAHSGIKRLNRKCENALLTAEKLAYTARTLGGRDRCAELTPAWKKVLFNQFHDILAGTCIREGYVSAQQDGDYALSAAEDVSNEALQFIGGNIDVPYIEGARPFIVYNPHAQDACWPVSCEIADVKGEYELLDARGNKIPWQKQTASAAANGRIKLCFTASVPALGWTRCMLVPCGGDAQSVTSVCVPVNQEPVLENDFLKVSFNPESGEISSLILKSTGEELLLRDSALLCFRDDSDTWSHGKLRFTGEPEEVKPVSIRAVSEGAVERSIKVVQTVGSSRVERTYTLYKNLPYLFTHVKIDWQETQKCLKIAYPLRLNYIHVRAQAPFGSADRQTDGEEYPMQEWVDVSGCASGAQTLPCGLGVLNDGKYSYDVHDRTLFITALRSPYYANHEPKTVDAAGEDYPVTDRGEQEFELVLVPHEGGQAIWELDRAAALLNAPLIIQSEYAHSGRLKSEYSFMKLEGEGVMLDALKAALDGSGDMIVHLHECERTRCEAELVLNEFGRRVKLKLEPGQLMALRINATGECRQTDFTENELMEVR